MKYYQSCTLFGTDTTFDSRAHERIYWREHEQVKPFDDYHQTLRLAFASMTMMNKNGNTNVDRPDGDTMTLLIPDRKKPNTEDFIWVLPIDRLKWNKWYELAKKLRTQCQGIRYMKRQEDGKLVTLLVMPNEKQTDDDAVTACAYLRMVEKVTCRIYVLRCADDASLSTGGLINAAVGVDPDTLHHVDEAEIDKEYEEKVNGNGK